MPRVCFCFWSVAAVVVLASASVTETESKEDEVVRVVATLARACFCLSICISTETEVNIEIVVVVWVVLVDVVAVESVRLGLIVALSSILTESEVNKEVVVVVRVDIVAVVSTPPTFHTISSSNGGVIVGRACFCWAADTSLSEDTVTVVEVVLLVLVPDAIIIVWVRVSFIAAGGLILLITQRGTWVVTLRLLSSHLSSSTSTHLGFKLP